MAKPTLIDFEISGLGNQENLQTIQTNTAHKLIKASCNASEVCYDDVGRPFIPSGPDISIAHARKEIFVGFVNAPHRIGVDVERLDRKIHSKHFSEYILDETEIPLLNRVMQKNRALIILWSLKESYFKASGESYFQPKNIIITDITESGAKMHEKQRKSDFSHIKTSFQIKKKHVYSCTIGRKFDHNIR